MKKWTNRILCLPAQATLGAVTDGFQVPGVPTTSGVVDVQPSMGLSFFDFGDRALALDLADWKQNEAHDNDSGAWTKCCNKC